MIREPFEEKSWAEVKGAEGEAFLKQLGQIEPQYDFKPASTRVHWQALPFFRDVAIVRVTQLGWHPAPLVLWFLAQKGRLTRLDGTAQPILRQAEAGLNLTPQTAIPYLAFFCFFVHAEGRPFRIVETVEALDLIAPVDPARAAKVKAAISPARIVKQDPEDGFEIDAAVLHGGGLYRCRFHLDGAGQATMLADEEIASGLPVLEAMEVA